jgi:hypothetical protein
VHDDDDYRLVRGIAWDVQTNTQNVMEDQFRKLIQRKVNVAGPKDRPRWETQWVVPDERDLRELTNRRGAICERNAIFKVMPKDLIEDAVARCEATTRDRTAKDPKAALKELLDDLAEVNVTVLMAEEALGGPLAQATPAQVTELFGVAKAIADKQTTWAEYVGRPEETVASPPPPVPGKVKAAEPIWLLPPWGTAAGLPIKDASEAVLLGYVIGLRALLKGPTKVALRAQNQATLDEIERVLVERTPSMTPADEALEHYCSVLGKIGLEEDDKAKAEIAKAGEDLRWDGPSWKKFEAYFVERWPVFRKK